jgi:outer membrane translocation and assembly module TamA
MPVLFRGPETGNGYGVAATYLFHLNPGSVEEVGGASNPSSVTAVAIHTSRKQMVISLEPVLRLRGDGLRLAGAAEYVKFPSTFWGIGNETDDALEEDYTPQAVNLEGQALWEVGPGWYWGLGARFARRWLFDVEPAGLLDRGLVPGSRSGQIVGLGVALTRDTRDRSENPRSGAYHQLEVGRFASFLGSDFEYTATSLDLRGYVPFSPANRLALRVLGESVHGTVPFDVLPQLGGDELLRGYYGGRYRDQSLLAVQAEARSDFRWRLGVVGFAEMGQVAASPSKLRLDGMKASLGGGLRFALDKAEGLNLRADYAWALEKGTRALYLSLGEVF